MLSCYCLQRSSLSMVKLSRGLQKGKGEWNQCLKGIKTDLDIMIGLGIKGGGKI